MALVVYDRVQETTATTGTGTITLAGAVAGYQSFAVVGNGNTTFYCIVNGSAWEVGIGTYTSSGTTLARTTVLSNSDGNTSPITLVGASNVFVTYPSERSVNLDASGNVTALGTITSAIWNGSTVGVAYGGTGVTTSSGANSVMLRDANQNVSINRLNQSSTTVTAAGGTTTLTAASTFSQILNGTGGQTFKLPDATTLTNTTTFEFNNNATGTLTIVDNASATVGTITSGGAAAISLLANSTVAGTWDVHAYIPESVTWGTNALALGTTVISGGTWQGGTIASGYGGTGLTTFAAANNALYSTSSSALAAGTLPVAAGGTGLTSLTAGYIPFGNGTSAFGSNSSLFWDNTNASLGIGTASPGLPLDVVSSSSAYAIRIRGRVADNIGILQFTNNAATVDSAGVLSPATNTLAFSTAGTERMRIDSSGNVGIGTSSPSVKLQVAGGVAIQGGGFPSAGAGVELSYNSGTGLASLQSYDRTGAAWKDLEVNALTQRFGTAGTERMRITSTGGVSFGSSGTAYGTSGQVLISNGNAAPSWSTNIGGNAATATTATTANALNTANIYTVAGLIGTGTGTNGGSIFGQSGIGAVNYDSAGFGVRIVASSTGTNGIVQWTNNAITAQWTSLVGTNNNLQCTTPFSATSFTGAGTGLTGTASSLSIGGNAATATTATLANTVSISHDRTDAAWYQAMWSPSGSSNLYSAAQVGIYSGNYGYIGFGSGGSTWYIGGNATYGLYTNTGLYAAGGLWDAGNRVYSAGNPQVNISGTATYGTYGRYVYNNGAVGGTVGYIEGSSLYVAYATNAGYAVSTSNTSSISSAVGGNYTWTGAQYFLSNGDTGSSYGVPLEAYSNNYSGAIMNFHRGGAFAVNFGLDSDNVMRLGGWSAAGSRWTCDMSGNGSYAGLVSAVSPGGGSGAVLVNQDYRMGRWVVGGGYFEVLVDGSAVGVSFFYSDENIKKNIAPSTYNALDIVNQIEFKEFDYDETKFPNSGHVKCGVIAQQLQSIDASLIEQKGDYLAPMIDEMVYVSLKAIQEMNLTIQAQQKQIDALIAKVGL